MAPITNSVEINRSPEEVFRYLDDLSRHDEWQSQIEKIEVLTDPPTRVGSRAKETRRVPGMSREFTYELTEHDPPRKAAFRVINGPVRPFGAVTVEPSGSGSRVTLTLDFAGHGLLGKLLAPLARRDAAKQVPKDQTLLKQRLEAGA